jgi:hypothetical protein
VHGRRFNAQRHDVDEVASDLRTVVQEFLSIAGLKMTRTLDLER